MNTGFVLPPDLIGKFAIVKLWPEIKTAEDECIARLKCAAKNLGLECLEILADGRLLENPASVISKSDVDFVLHLHYDTPKLYDAFSLVALWNPMQFYHEWGYARTSRNLLSHDDFVSCSSSAADDHVNRLIRKNSTHLPALFNLYHSIADIVHAPTLGDCKLFYAGINWDALRGGVSRHQELLKRLDSTGNLRIYGPVLFQGVRVWKGYQSYVKEIPFDGVSMLDEISKAGIALVLSSQAHKDSELMSNRLFESVAAGAMVICDENNFAKKYFGDTLLYIDTRETIDEVYENINQHLDWIKTHPEEALVMIEKAQKIFKDKFCLNHSLAKLYAGLEERKHALLKHQYAANEDLIVCMYMIIMDFSLDVLELHIRNAASQEYQALVPVLLVDRSVYAEYKRVIDERLSAAKVKIHCYVVDYFNVTQKSITKLRRKLGDVFNEVLSKTSEVDVVVFVAPNERIFSNHIQVLVGALQRDENIGCAATAVILKSGQEPIHSVQDRIDFREFYSHFPMGFARFAFRLSKLPKDLQIALPYLDKKALAVLVGDGKISAEVPSTVIIDVEQNFPNGQWDEGQENNLIASYTPQVFNPNFGHEIIIPALSSQSKVQSVMRGMKRFSWNWFQAQLNAVRRDGISARVSVLKRRIKGDFA